MLSLDLFILGCFRHPPLSRDNSRDTMPSSRAIFAAHTHLVHLMGMDNNRATANERLDIKSITKRTRLKGRDRLKGRTKKQPDPD